ncbi:Alpha-1,3-mannosyltransferase-like protein, partial [Physocladia obscura]
KTIILSINRFERKKNIGLAIDAFSLLKIKCPKQFKDLVLVVAGGYDTRVQENVEHLQELEIAAAKTHSLKTTVTETLNSPGITDAQIIFLLSFDDSHRSFLLSQALCLIYTPQNEHFGIVPVEAMYAKLPVIAANSGGPLESILDGITGYLCDGTNTDEFANAIAILAEQPALKRKIGEAGRKRVIEKFTLDAFTTQLESHLNSLFADFNWDAMWAYILVVFLWPTAILGGIWLLLVVLGK